MTPRRTWFGLVLVALLAAGCGGGSDGPEKETKAATVESVPGSELSRVTLTEDAARRLDVKLEAVAGGGEQPTQIPYGAVLYDPQGRTWTFVNPEALTFVRQAITVDHIDGQVAFLSAGPPPGTKVVTQGATEIYGAEVGVGDE
ncbi:MAG: hypothetical protein QOI99_975 [Actinomycetota bacterium]|jgi:hypothetical protein|nr:hypothetical protein [Actinomycetota bacterium]